MRVHSINVTTPKFKGIREDRNTTSQLKEDNTYSLTEPNQRRISQAIENLAKQRGEENIKFLLNVGENLAYQTNINNGKATKNEWRTKLKNAAESSLAISDPILKEKYGAEITRVFEGEKPLSDMEKKIVGHRNSIMARADLDSLKSNPNENIRNLESNLDYFIASTETPTKQKAYVLERLDYMMSPNYEINPQLENKKTQVLAEMINDMVINTPDSKIPNMKAVNQKTHGMCAAISIARKAVAYEDKSNYVDALLSELDSSPFVMVYDRHNLGSGQRVPVEKTHVDFDYAEEKGYRIIDASTLQWMGIAGMYGAKNEKLHDFIPFDKENFDAFHDSFFAKTINDDELRAKHSYYQALVKAKDEIESVKAGRILKGVNAVNQRESYDKNIELVSKYNENTRENISSIVPDITKEELAEDMLVLKSLYAPNSEKLNKIDKKIRKYGFIPNEESSQKTKRVQQYFVDKYSDRVSKSDINDNLSNIVSNVSTVVSLENSLTNSSSLSGKIANARKLYGAEAGYRASIEMGLADRDVLTDYLIHYNIPDKESRIVDGYNTVIERINHGDKKLTNHFAKVLGVDSNDKESIVSNLSEIRDSVDYIQTDGLDELYMQMGVGNRRAVLMSQIEASKTDVLNGDKAEQQRLAKIMNIKDDKKRVVGELEKLGENILNNPNDEHVYKNVYNKMGNKDEMFDFVGVHQMFIENITDKENPESAEYLEAFKQTNGIPETASEEEVNAILNTHAQTFNVYAQSVANAASILDVPNDDGSMYFTINDSKLVIKKMENEGKLVPKKDMEALQARFNKIDKVRSSDEFASRQGKISDSSLYKLTTPEKEAIKKIDKKLNTMYSDTTRELNYIYRSIKEPLEKHAKYIGTNEGTYWVGADGNSGLYDNQQVKIFEQLTDKPYQAIADIEKALDIIKTSPNSGISSSSVFNDRAGGWHAQYVADVTGVGKNNREAMFHDNTWGASEHENSWVDSDGLMRTDYSDRRGGDFGYITNNDWRNGNFVDELTEQAGHITPNEVENRVYKKLRPKGSEYDYNTLTGIIVQGVSPDYKDIAASIKDTIFVPDSIFLGNIAASAKNMTVKELQKAIFRNETAGTMYHDKLDKLNKRIKSSPFNNGISTLEDYNKLSDNDIVKLTFEKAAIRIAYPDAPMYNELGNALTMKDVLKVKKAQKDVALDNFDYSFGKTTDVMNYLKQEHSKDIADIVVNSFQKNGIELEKSADVVRNIFVFEDDEKSRFTGRMKDTIDFVVEKLETQFDKTISHTENSDVAKSEISTGLRDLLEQSLYFNKEDLAVQTDKAKGIREWIDTKFNPVTDDDFVSKYREIQDMSLEEFAELKKGVTDKQLGISERTGFDMLKKYKAADDNTESTVRNILFYEEYMKDMNVSKTKPTHRYTKTEKKTRGAVYVGKRSFDDLYRSMYSSLSSLTYEKMFNKWKDANYRKYGAFPAYPKLDLSNNSGIKSSINDLYEKVGETMSEVISKKNIQRDYVLADELKAYSELLKPEKKVTEPERKHIQKLAGEFVMLNMEDDSISASVEAAYNLLGTEKGVDYSTIAKNVDVIVKEFDVIKKANSSVDLDEYIKKMATLADKYTDTIIDINIPPRFQNKLRAEAREWQNLEMKYAMGNSVESKGLQMLQEKIGKHSIKPMSERQINSFDKIQELVMRTKKLNSKETPDKAKIRENEAKIAEMSRKYVDRYITADSRDRVMANITDWSSSVIRSKNKKVVTEDDVMDARDRFERDFFKYHLTSNPIDLLNTYLLLSAKDADKVYPDKVDKIKAYERLVSDELTLTRFVEIQDALMEAVQTGNTAHVKEYFDDYTIDAGESVKMSSDEALDYMIKYLLLDDNTKTAKMFVEKLGLGDRVLKLETEAIKEADVGKMIDKTAKSIRSAGTFSSVVTSEHDMLMSKINDVEDVDGAIDETKNNIVLKFRRKGVDRKLVKGYLAALDDLKTVIKENPEMAKSVLYDSIHSQVLSECQGLIRDDLEEKQGYINSVYSLYKFLLALRLPGYSEGYRLQQQLQTDYDAILKYNNTVLTAAQSGDGSVVKLKNV